MQIILQNHTYFSTFCSKNSSLMPSNYTQRLFESVRTYVRITASIQSPKVRHALGRRWYIRIIMPKLHKIASYQMLNCTNLQKNATPM